MILQWLFTHTACDQWQVWAVTPCTLEPSIGPPHKVELLYAHHRPSIPWSQLCSPSGLLSVLTLDLRMNRNLLERFVRSYLFIILDGLLASDRWSASYLVVMEPMFTFSSAWVHLSMCSHSLQACWGTCGKDWHVSCAAEARMNSCEHKVHFYVEYDCSIVSNHQQDWRGPPSPYILHLLSRTPKLLWYICLCRLQQGEQPGVHLRAALSPPNVSHSPCLVWTTRAGVVSLCFCTSARDSGCLQSPAHSHTSNHFYFSINQCYWKDQLRTYVHTCKQEGWKAGILTDTFHPFYHSDKYNSRHSLFAHISTRSYQHAPWFYT